MKPRCLDCRKKPVSARLAERHGIALFCSVRCASNHAHLTSHTYLACPKCGQQNAAEDFDQQSRTGETPATIECPECGHHFTEPEAAR